MTIATADPIHHRAQCSKREPFETVGKMGDALLRCRNCNRFVMLDSARAAGRRPVAAAEPREVLPMPRPSRVRPAAVVAVVEPAPVPAPVAVTLASRYRCRDHNKPVNWRGRGCPACTRFLAMTPAERRDARRQAQS